jgi:MFS family permease
LAIYAALSGAFFFAGIYLQNTLGYSALQAGASLFPVSIIIFFLSARFGRLAGRDGLRSYLTGGALLFGVGALLFLRVAPGVAYWSTILPAVTVMGFGLALIVAPLTAAVMGAVPSHNAGIASAINNVASRVAGLLAIAALGAVVAVSFDAARSDRCPHADRSAAGDRCGDRRVCHRGIPPGDDRLRARRGVGRAGGCDDHRAGRETGRHHSRGRR